MKRLEVVKIAIPKVIYGFNAVLIKILAGFFAETDKMNVRGLILPNFKT